MSGQPSIILDEIADFLHFFEMMADAVAQKKMVAVIDIGTAAIRMLIAEVDVKGDVRTLENLQKPVPFGRDVFTKGRMGNQVMRQAIDILKDFKSVMDSYGVSHVQAIATSAVREAVNRDNFLDQVYVRTGIDIEVIEGPEQNRLGLIAVESALRNKIDLEKKNCLIIEVGSGSTEMILLNQGRVEVTRTVSLGSVRLPDQIVLGKTDSSAMQRILKRHVHEIVSYAFLDSHH